MGQELSADQCPWRRYDIRTPDVTASEPTPCVCDLATACLRRRGWDLSFGDWQGAATHELVGARHSHPGIIWTESKLATHLLQPECFLRARGVGKAGTIPSERRVECVE